MNLRSEVGVGKGEKRDCERQAWEFLQDVLLAIGGKEPPGPRTWTSSLLGKITSIYGRLEKCPHSRFFGGGVGCEVDQGLYTYTCASSTRIPSPCHHS